MPMSFSHCLCCVLMALGLLVGLVGDVKAQLTYSFITFDVPGLSDTWASGINDSGQIVGSYPDAAGWHGFLLDNGSYTTLDVPGSLSTRAIGINATGQIVGSYWDGSTDRGFLLD